MTQKNSILLLLAVLIGVAASWLFLPKKQKSPIVVHEDTLIVGTNSEFPPFSFLENDELTGFDIAVIKEIARRLGKKISLQDMPFEALMTALQTGSIYVIAAGMSPTEERSAIVLFSNLIYSGSPLAIVTLTTTTNIIKPADLVGKTVAVNEGYFADYYTSALPGVSIMRLASASISEGLMALESGRAHAFIASISTIKPFLSHDHAQKFLFHSIDNTQEQDAFAISKQQPELYQQINQAIKDMEADGSLKALQQQWMLE